MVWREKTAHEICKGLLDRRLNGNRSPGQIVEHLNSDLVLWGWNPGPGRSPIPIDQKVFLEQARLWVIDGAACP
jgi:hypothetical protein